MAVKGFGVPDLVIRISVLVVLSALSVLLSGNVLVPINLVAVIFDLINTGTGDHLQVVKSPVTEVNSISALLFVAIWHVGRDLQSTCREMGPATSTVLGLGSVFGLEYRPRVCPGARGC